MSMNNTPDVSSGYEPPSPGPMNATPGALTPAPQKGISKPLLAILVVAAVLTLGIPGFLIFGAHGSSLFVDRHGLPSNVPLPSGATFKLVHDLSDSSGTAKDWYWTVDSPNNPAALQNFYQSNLSSNGWTNINTRGSGNDYEVTGCQGNQAIYVAMSASLDVTDAQSSDPSTITGPSGGSALEILVGSQPDALSYARCS